MGLTWSVSRDQILHSCERKYYFKYLIPARINSRDSSRKQIALLRKLTNVPMWRGKIFHSIIAEYLRNKRKRSGISLEDVLEQFMQLAREQWTSSVNKSSASLLEKIEYVRNNGVLLMEHFYQEDVTEDLLLTTINDIETRVELFKNWTSENNIIAILRGCPKIWIEPGGYGSRATGFKINGNRIIIKVDLALLTPERQFIIFDWKTSSPPKPMISIDSTAFQALTYQLWPFFTLKVPLENISTRMVFFDKESSTVESYEINENSKEYVLGLIRRSLKKMEYFNQVSHSRQERLDLVSRFTVKDLDFAYTKYTCIFCSFKLLCRKELGL